MTKIAPILLAVLALSLSACSRTAELHIYTWADYIKPELVARFEKEHNCRVIIDTFDSNESMYAKVRAGAAGYDILVPSTYMVDIMRQQGLLAPIDHSALKNLGNIDPGIVEKIPDKKMEHGIPYATSYGVLAYRKDLVPNPTASWSMLERPALLHKTSLLDDMRETLGAALRSLGHSVNTRDEAQIAAAGEVVKRWRQNAVKFDNEQYKSAVDSGEFHLVHGYSGDLFQVVSENDKVGILIPEEGVVVACDELVVPTNAPQMKLAYQFIDFVLDPKVAAENMEWMGYLCPNSPGLKLVSKTFLENPAVSISPEVLKRSEVIHDLGEDRAKYSKVWDEIKAAR